MTVDQGPARAKHDFREFREIHQRIDGIERAVNTALGELTRIIHQRLDDEVATWGDVPERVARLEDLLNPLTVDPTDPDVEWHYRRGDGILRPAPTDQTERAAMIAAGVRLYPVVNRTREDGRLAVTPPPRMAV